MGGLSGIGLVVGLLRLGDAVLDATLDRTVVASVGDDLVESLLVYECCRLIAGGVIVAAVRGLLLSEWFAMV